MRKFIYLAVAALALTSVGSASFAGEVKGQQLMPMLSGKTLSCRARGKDLSLRFGKATAASSAIAFNYVLGGKPGSGTYVLTKSGRLKHKETGATRKFGFNKKKQLTITGGGAPSATCEWP